MEGEIGHAVDPTKAEDLLTANDQPSQKAATFEVEAKALQYMMAAAIYHSDQG